MTGPVVLGSAAVPANVTVLPLSVPVPMVPVGSLAMVKVRQPSWLSAPGPTFCAVTQTWWLPLPSTSWKLNPWLAPNAGYTAATSERAAPASTEVFGTPLSLSLTCSTVVGASVSAVQPEPVTEPSGATASVSRVPVGLLLAACACSGSTKASTSASTPNSAASGRVVRRLVWLAGAVSSM